MNGAKIADFLIDITPELLRFGRDLLQLHGNPETVVREIQDRRVEVAQRRAANDAALVEKYRSTEPEKG